MIDSGALKTPTFDASEEEAIKGQAAAAGEGVFANTFLCGSAAGDRVVNGTSLRRQKEVETDKEGQYGPGIVS